MRRSIAVAGTAVGRGPDTLNRMASAVRRGTLAVLTFVALGAIGVGIGLADPWVTQPAQESGGPVDRDALMAWLARVLLVLAIAWVVIGMLAARTPLIRRPGAAAARATWLASTRPWRARESTLGMLRADRVLLFSVPVALLVATGAVSTSFMSWLQLAVFLVAWAIFAVVLRVVVASRSPYPVVAAVGGVVMLWCILQLCVLASAPGASGSDLLTSAARVTYTTLSFALFVWVFVAAGWTLATQIGVRRGIGAVLAAVGAALALPSLVVGVEGTWTALADRGGQLPWGFAEVIGAMAHPGIWANGPWVTFWVSAVVAVVGALLAVPWRSSSARSGR